MVDVVNYELSNYPTAQLTGGAAPAEETRQDHPQRQKQQEVNQAAGDVEQEADYPEQQNQDDQCADHRYLYREIWQVVCHSAGIGLNPVIT